MGLVLTVDSAQRGGRRGNKSWRCHRRCLPKGNFRSYSAALFHLLVPLHFLVVGVGGAALSPEQRPSSALFPLPGLTPGLNVLFGQCW